ncbi:MAG: hypothetical protein ACI397_03995 [Paludibacteraceae bacterium]
MIVGEGGISPDYFLRRMQWWEVQRYLAGLRRRQRPLWENTRWLGHMIAKMLCGRNIPSDLQEFYEFPWETEPIDPDQLARDNAALIEQIRREQAAKAEEQTSNRSLALRT